MQWRHSGVIMDRWAVHLFWRIGMTPVDICVYVAFTYDAAFAYAKTLPFVCNKKRGWWVKKWGTKAIDRGDWGERIDNRHYRHRAEYVHEPHEPPDEAYEEEDAAESPPILLPASTPPPQATQPVLFEVVSVWKHSKPTKRRL